MDLRKQRISFKWRIFIPLAILLWMTIVAMAFLHYSDAVSDVMRICLIIALTIFVTIATYLSSRFFSRSVGILRDFAHRVANDEPFEPEQKFPHTELGDISHQIVNLYNKRRKEQQRREKDHRVALRAIEEKSLFKRQLTNNINHEIKTPVGIIKGYLDTIMDNPDMDEETRLQFMSKAQEHMERLCTLLNDISTMTRLDEIEGKLPTEEINYHDLVFTVVSDIEESGTLGKMEFIYDLPYDCMVQGNYNLLSNMLLNLAKNAIAYSRGTEMGLKMVANSKKHYTFCFYDNGIGVEEKYIPHLFDRFFRIDSGRSRKNGGTGLGLPIVQNTILSHGGAISVKNRLGGGLEFMFTLPKAISETRNMFR